MPVLKNKPEPDFHQLGDTWVWRGNFFIRLDRHLELRFLPGLPDFSTYNIPKRGKKYQMTNNIQNGHKIDQMGL
jgi:hypothetical protein